MIAKYSVTLVALVISLITGAIILVLLGPSLHADTSLVTQLVGILGVGLLVILGVRQNEANGHRLTNVENQASSNTNKLDAADVPPDPSPPSLM